MDYDHSRLNMIMHQLRSYNVNDANILSVFKKIKRENFLSKEYKKLAFIDANIPLKNSEQFMLTPKDEARLINVSALKQTDKVLEIGTGSGFFTALLAKLAKHITTVEIDEDQLKIAQSNLTEYSNIHFENRNITIKWTKQKKYDVIFCIPSMPQIPQSLLDNLNIAGRLIVMLYKNQYFAEAQLITRTRYDKWHVESLFETCAPSMLEYNIFKDAIIL